jgi:anti-anti-sigma factor
LAGAAPVSVQAVMAPDLVTVVVSGDLDAVTMSVVAARLAEVVTYRPRRLVFDLAQVGFIDCAATRLITSSGAILPDGGRPVLRRPSAAVRRLLDLTDLGAGCEVEG